MLRYEKREIDHFSLCRSNRPQIHGYVCISIETTVKRLQVQETKPKYSQTLNSGSKPSGWRR